MLFSLKVFFGLQVLAKKYFLEIHWGIGLENTLFLSQVQENQQALGSDFRTKEFYKISGVILYGWSYFHITRNCRHFCTDIVFDPETNMATLSGKMQQGLRKRLNMRTKSGGSASDYQFITYHRTYEIKTYGMVGYLNLFG